MLRWRLTLGTLFVGLLVGLCWLDAYSMVPGAWLLPLALLLTVAATQETVDLLTVDAIRPRAWVAYLGSLLVVASNALPLFAVELLPAQAWPFVTFGVVMFGAFAVEIFDYLPQQQTTTRLALTVLAIVYVGVCLSSVVQLRLLGPGVGLAALGALIVVVKLSDTGAYTVGRLVGRTKLAPKLSPGKTIEGSLGGLIAGVLGALWAFHWLLPRLAERPVELIPGTWLWFGLAVGIAGMLGDLAESLFKREAGRKDSSRWMPGFGGVLDLLDSILLGAPVALLVWVLCVS